MEPVYTSGPAWKKSAAEMQSDGGGGRGVGDGGGGRGAGDGGGGRGDGAGRRGGGGSTGDQSTLVDAVVLVNRFAPDTTPEYILITKVLE